MPLENPETLERTANAVNFVFVETLVDAYGLQLGTAQLKAGFTADLEGSFNRKVHRVWELY
jgi:hypothetical protein